MRGYFAIGMMRIRTLLHYRSAALAGITTQVFWGLINVMILKAFYSGYTGREPLALSQAITFIWLGQSLIQILPWSIDKQVEAQIKNGNIVYELVRPLNLYGHFFARAFAMRFAPTMMRLFFVLFVACFLGLTPPVSYAAGLAFCFSLMLSFCLAAAITTGVSISLFWTISGEGLQKLMPSCAVLLSGIVVPLPLFPHGIQVFLNLQPFRGLIDIPARLYTGVIPVEQTSYYFMFQLAWIVILVVLGRMCMQKAMRHLVVQGG